MSLEQNQQGNFPSDNGQFFIILMIILTIINALYQFLKAGYNQYNN